MKKVLSIVLAVAMLFAVCVPAFATDITKDAPTPVDNVQTATADVYTKTTDKDGNEVYTYSVTFPASTEIAWGDTSAQNVGYTVTSQLLLGAKLKVKVEAVNGGAMTATGTDKSLTFTLDNGAETEFGEVNDAAHAAADATVTVASFAGVPLAQYKGQLTYTVTYVAPVGA